MSNPYPQPGYPASAAFSWIANASNVKTQTNPSFTVADFLGFYTQFNGLIEENILEEFIAMATVCVLQIRWHEQWRFAMCLFIAHFATLYIQSLSSDNPTAQQVINAAQGTGLEASKSVGDVSVSYDFSVLLKGIEDWAMWNATSYGRQYATLARMLGKAGMYVW